MKEFVKVVDFIPGTKFAKTITCNLCGEKVYEVSNSPTSQEVRTEATGMAIHLELLHDLKFTLVVCEDPNCRKEH
ncbi:MAG TPA: hypothetical protein VF905_09485 [Nitrospirota bacterium]